MRAWAVVASLVVLGCLSCGVGSVQSQSVEWMPVPTDRLLADSDLVVVGTLASIDTAVHDDGWSDLGHIVVTRVLQGRRPEGDVTLSFPSRHPAALGGRSVTPAATDVVYEEKMEGVWFLKKAPGQSYYLASHPGRFRPLIFLASIEAQMKRMSSKN